MTPNEINIALGRRIRRRRQALDLTQQDVAEAIGIRFQQIQKYECAANKMSAARAVEIAKVLDMPVGQLFEGLL